MKSDPGPHPEPMDAVMLTKADFRPLGGGLLYLVHCTPMEGLSRLAPARLYLLTIPPHDDSWVLQEITAMAFAPVLLALQHMSRLISGKPDHQFIRSGIHCLARSQFTDGNVFPEPPAALFTADDIIGTNEQFDATTRDLINHHCFPNGINRPGRSRKETRPHA